MGAGVRRQFTYQLIGSTITDPIVRAAMVAALAQVDAHYQELEIVNWNRVERGLPPLESVHEFLVHKERTE